LGRRVAEDSLAQQVKEAAGEQMAHKAALECIKQWYLASSGSEGDGEKWNDDEAFFDWKDDAKNYENHLEELKAKRVSRLFSHLAENPDTKALPNGLSLLLGEVSCGFFLNNNWAEVSSAFSFFLLVLIHSSL
jgi:acetyl-CoA carboxylase/biotin carboxylase 1